MMTDIRILLVDDEEFYLRLYSDILATRRFAVRNAKSGKEAMVLLQQERFDILITDLLMKEMDGLELTEQVRNHFPWVDIIVVTQRDDVRLAVRSMRMGVFEYLVKPIDRDELLLTLDRLLERRRLLDQQNKLVDESMQYMEAQTVYRRCLDILSALDFENLCAMILEHLLQATGAQGGLLWLASPEERSEAGGADRLNLTGYRGLVKLEDFPAFIAVGNGPFQDTLGAGMPFFASAASVLGQSHPSHTSSEALFIPLLVDGQPVGLLLLLDKLREDFTERDLNIARTMAQFSAIALKNSRRFQALERLGLRDQASTAYNMTYFIDYAGKEIYKARRYGRCFSLVTVTIDRFDFLRQRYKPEVTSRMSRRLAESISRVIRDSDVLARVSDHEYYLLLPETDSLGARMFVRRSQAAFASDPYIREMDRNYPVGISMGVATFPLDGGDFDQLLVTCREETDGARNSLYRRLQLDPRELWAAVGVLVGRPADHLGPLEQASEAFRLAEDGDSCSVHGIFPEEMVDVIEEEVCRQAVDVPERRSVIYALGGRIEDEPRPFERVLEGADGARAFLIGHKGSANLPDGFASVTRVFVDDPAVDRHRLLLVLGERLAYAFFGERGDEGRIYGFHSHDQYLVEHMIVRLQTHYNFQPQY